MTVDFHENWVVDVGVHSLVLEVESLLVLEQAYDISYRVVVDVEGVGQVPKRHLVVDVVE